MHFELRVSAQTSLEMTWAKWPWGIGTTFEAISEPSCQKQAFRAGLLWIVSKCPKMGRVPRSRRHDKMSLGQRRGQFWGVNSRGSILCTANSLFGQLDRGRFGEWALGYWLTTKEENGRTVWSSTAAPGGVRRHGTGRRTKRDKQEGRTRGRRACPEFVRIPRSPTFRTESGRSGSRK